MHKDAPLVVGKRLKEIMSRNNPEFKSFRETAYAIGDGSYDWQRELLGRLVQFAGDKSSGNSSSALQALSITIWRSEKNVFYLNKEQLGVILNSLAKLFSSLKEIKKDKMNEEWITSLTFLFELLLGLLRAAESPDPEIKALLSLRNPDIVSLIESVDAISDKISGINGVKMNFRITLQLNKPEELCYNIQIQFSRLNHK
jgi:hypothetical protein